MIINDLHELYSSTKEVFMMRATVVQHRIMVHWLWAMALKTVRIIGLSKTGIAIWLQDETDVIVV